MRKFLSFALIVCLAILPGCSLYGMMVSSFGDHYTGGGTTHFEKEEHFAKERERWKDYEPDSDFH